MLHYIIPISIGQFNWQSRKCELTIRNSKWVKSLSWESSSITLPTVHFTLAHCAFARLSVCPSVRLPGCLSVPVSGWIIRWLSAFALIYEESAASDHSISDTTMGNTVQGGTWYSTHRGSGSVEKGSLPRCQEYLHFVRLCVCLSRGWVQLARLKRLPGELRWSWSWSWSRGLGLTKVTMLTGQDEALP